MPVKSLTPTCVTQSVGQVNVTWPFPQSSSAPKTLAARPVSVSVCVFCFPIQFAGLLSTRRTRIKSLSIPATDNGLMNQNQLTICVIAAFCYCLPCWYASGRKTNSKLKSKQKQHQESKNKYVKVIRSRTKALKVIERCENLLLIQTKLCIQENSSGI